MKKHQQLSKWPIITIAVIASILVIYFIYRDFKPELVMLFNLNHHNRTVLAHMMRSHGLRDMVLLTLSWSLFLMPFQVYLTLFFVYLLDFVLVLGSVGLSTGSAMS